MTFQISHEISLLQFSIKARFHNVKPGQSDFLLKVKYAAYHMPQIEPHTAA